MELAGLEKKSFFNWVYNCKGMTSYVAVCPLATLTFQNPQSIVSFDMILHMPKQYLLMSSGLSPLICTSIHCIWACFTSGLGFFFIILKVADVRDNHLF